MCTWSDWSTSVRGGSYSAEAGVYTALCAWLAVATSLPSHSPRCHPATGWSQATNCTSALERTQGDDADRDNVIQYYTQQICKERKSLVRCSIEVSKD